MVKMMLMKTNNHYDHHNSRSNSLKSEYGGRDCKEFSSIPCGSALRSPIGPAQQIHTSHEGEHTVAAQHTQSQAALYLIVPPPSLLLICLKLQIICVSFVLVWVLSSLVFSHCILLCPLSCKFVVLFPISLVCMGNLRYQRVIRVWIAKKRADGQ